MKKHLLFTFLAVLTLHVTATAQTTLDEWTFDGATPQTSDILNKTMGNWDPTLAGTSVPSAGLLRDATGGNSAGAFYGDNLGLTTMPNNVVLTVEIADINHTQRDYWFEFQGAVGGNTRLDINAFNGGIVIDLWGAGTKHYDGPSKIFDTDDYTGAISLTVSAQWDIANGKIAYTISGDGVGYTGTGSSAFSDTQTVSADLSAITNIRSMRVRGGTVASGEYIDLDKVTLTYNAPTLSTPKTVLDNAKVWYSNSANALHIEGVTAQSVRVYALSGAKVAQYDNPGNTIALGDLSSGLYIASVLSEHGTKAFKFVK
jgi:hypothetical protein